MRSISIKFIEITLDELYKSDIEHIETIKKRILINETRKLYNEFKSNNENIITEMRQYNLEDLLNHFRFLQVQDSVSINKNDFTNLFIDYFMGHQKDLFNTYGPFSDLSVKDYVYDAIEKREKEDPRDTYRLAIRLKNEIIGVFIFNSIPKIMNENYECGDLGIFMDPKYGSTYLIQILFAAFIFFYGKIFPMHKNRIGAEHVTMKKTFITASTHPLNYTTQNIIEKFMDNNGSKNVVPSKFGPRIYYSNNMKDMFKQCKESKYFVHMMKDNRILNKSLEKYFDFFIDGNRQNLSFFEDILSEIKK